METLGIQDRQDSYDSRQETGNPCAEIGQSAIPIKNPDVCMRDTDEEDGMLLVYVPATDGVFLMNAAAREIFDLCDGTQTAGAIIECLESTHEIPPSVSVCDTVLNLLASLKAVQMISLS